jgi:hypothetical protein
MKINFGYRKVFIRQKITLKKKKRKMVMKKEILERNSRTD